MNHGGHGGDGSYSPLLSVSFVVSSYRSIQSSS